MEIIDRQERKLQSKKFVSMKVRWKNLSIEEDTWESEIHMPVKYPHIFQSIGIHLFLNLGTEYLKV